MFKLASSLVLFILFNIFKWSFPRGLSLLQFSSVQSLSRVQLFATHGLQHARLPYPSPIPGVCSNLYPLSWWWHPTISASVVPSPPTFNLPQHQGLFSMSEFITSGGQSIGASASASVLPMNIQDWFPLGLTGWISLQSKEFSRIFSNTTVQKHRFFCAQLSENFQTLTFIHDYWEKP